MDSRMMEVLADVLVSKIMEKVSPSQQATQPILVGGESPGYSGTSPARRRGVPSPKKRGGRMTANRKEYKAYLRSLVRKYSLATRKSNFFERAIDEAVEVKRFKDDSVTRLIIRRDLSEVICNVTRYKNKKSKLLQRRLNYEVVPDVYRVPTPPLPQSEQEPTQGSEADDELTALPEAEDIAEPEDELCVGQFIAVVYDRVWYPAQLLQRIENNFEVNFMARRGCNKFVWPDREDRLWVERKQILTILSDIYPKGRRFLKVSDEEYARLNDLMEK